MNSKPRQAPPGGVSAVAHTLTANDAATLTLSVAEQMTLLVYWATRGGFLG
jgi:hypothetical protein